MPSRRSGGGPVGGDADLPRGPAGGRDWVLAVAGRVYRGEGEWGLSEAGGALSGYYGDECEFLPLVVSTSKT